MFAVVKTGGKQYKVEVGSVVKVEKLAAEANSEVELNEVLLVGEGDNVTFGTPVVEGAKVIAVVKEHIKGEKKISFKYNKKTYYKKQGHRQQYTVIEVKAINA